MNDPDGHTKGNPVALTQEQAQEQALAQNPNANVAELQRRAHDLVSKSQLLDFETAFANTRAEREARLADESRARAETMRSQQSRLDSLRWGTAKPGDAPAFPGTTPTKPESRAVETSARGDAQRLAEAIRRAGH
jgi:hypothetical protein